MRTSTCSRGTASSSAATWVSAVRAPVPMSAAVTLTTYRPASSATEAVEGMLRAG